MKEQELQEKVAMYQILQQYLEALQQQANLLQNKMVELQSTKQALQNFDEIKKSDVLIPLGSGCYAHGKLEEGKILTDIGAGVVLEREVSKAIESLEVREKDIESALQKLQKDAEAAAKNIALLAQEIQKLTSP